VKYATYWKGIGFELGLDHKTISDISKDNPDNIVVACEWMFQRWKYKNPLATWGELDDAIIKVLSRDDTGMYVLLLYNQQVKLSIQDSLLS